MRQMVIIVTLLLFPTVVFPCSFKEKTDEENFNSAKAVFLAKIIETKLGTLKNPDNPKESIETVEGKFIVKEKFKGEPPVSGYVKDFVFCRAIAT